MASTHSRSPLLTTSAPPEREWSVPGASPHDARVPQKGSDPPSAGGANGRVPRAHVSVASSWRNHSHPSTTRLVKNYDPIVVADPNFDGILKNHSLAEHNSDVAGGEFVRHLEYISQWNGSESVKAARFYPSSTTDRRNATVKVELSLDERTSHGEARDVTLERDVEAAINRARRGRAETSAVTGRGGGYDQVTRTWLVRHAPTTRQARRHVLPQKTARGRCFEMNSAGRICRAPSPTEFVGGGTYLARAMIASLT